MAEKISAEVVIGGKVYTLSGYEEEEYLQKVAAYLNAKMNELNSVEAFKRFPPDMKAILLHLNIADDYFKAKNYVEKLEKEAEIKEKEIYNLKHELASSQIKIESNEQSIKELENENKELWLENTKLETELKSIKERQE